jgi:hypothetical protein
MTKQQYLMLENLLNELKKDEEERFHNSCLTKGPLYIEEATKFHLILMSGIDDALQRIKVRADNAL